MNLIHKINIILYVLVGIIPNLESIDKVTTQWLYLNLLNTISLLFYLIIDYPLKNILKSKVSILFLCFFFWSTISMVFAINRIESLVVLSQILAIVIAFFVLTICIKKIEKPFKFISNVISIFLIIELVNIYFPFFILDEAKSKIFNRSSIFLGFAANINITAFSIIYKLPFFIFSIMQSKKNKFLLYFIALLVFSLIIFAAGTLNSTRGAILTYSLLVPILIIISISIYIKSKESRLFVFSCIYGLTVLLSYPSNLLLADSYNKSESSITNRISSLNALIDKEVNLDQSLTQRKDFYKQALITIKNNPVFGVGIGNWKIKSIDTNKENIVGYTVPYHVHNDYLEIGAEIGLVGLSIYLSILFFSFRKYVSRFFKLILPHSTLEKNYLEIILVSIFLFIWILDSNFNFPFHRPIELINLIALLAYLNSKKISNKYEKQI
ncbi:MAG: O-antigen ligase family protein [Flavobacteriaceae bacterium]